MFCHKTKLRSESINNVLCIFEENCTRYCRCSVSRQTDIYNLMYIHYNAIPPTVMHHVWSWPTLLTVSCMKAKSFKSDSQIQFIYIVLNRRLHIITKTFSIEFPQKSLKNIPNADFVLTVSQYANRSSMLHLKAIKKSSLIRHLQTFTASLGSLWNIYKSQSPYEQSPLLPSSWLTT